MKPFILPLLFLFGATAAYSQPTPPEVQLLTVNDGLSQGMVMDILQSRDGFIWIATKDGLNRYDGSRFKVFSPDPFNPFAIGSGVVQQIFEDSRGWIWIVHAEGLDVFDAVSGRFFHVMHEGKPFDGNLIRNLVETPDGAIWFASSDRVWKINPVGDMLKKAAKSGKSLLEMPCKSIPLSEVHGWSGAPLQAHSFYCTSEGVLLLGTFHGFFRINPESEEIVHDPIIPDSEVRGFVTNKAGDILIQRNLNQIDFWNLISNGQLYEQQVRLRNTGVFDREGYLWTFKIDEKIIQKWRLSKLFSNGKPELEIRPEILGLENNNGYSCSEFIVDQSGIIWIGTSGFGVIKINEKGKKFKTSLPGNAHRLMYEDPVTGALFTETVKDKKFLSRSFEHSTPNTDVPLNQFNFNRFLTFDPEGNIWWLHESRIHRFRAADKAKSDFPLEGLALLYDRAGKLVSIDENGLHRFDPTQETSQDFPFEQKQKRLTENSNLLYEDVDGVIWIFDLEGLIKATPNQSGYQYHQYLNIPTDRHSLSINTVLSVCDDPVEPARYLWVGTKGGGLNRLDKQAGTFKKYSKEQGLPDNVVYGVLTQNKSPYVWLSTNRGLCRFDIQTEATKNFTVADGLQGNEFNSAGYLKTNDGYLLFAGMNGINIFHPDSLRFNNNVPQVHIVGLQVNNQPFDFSGQSSVTLLHNQNLLNFEFAALEFTNPAQNQYRYQLVGIDKGWISLGNKNSIQFANLTPGDYTFKVEGSNNDGIWSEQAAELHFTILPPWYASWLAYLFYLVLGGAAIWLIYQNRLRQKMEQQEAMRLQELDDFKSRFFTNITHEFRTPLTVMLGMSEQLDKEEKDEPKRNKIGLIKRSGENLLRLVNQILDLAKLESNTLKMNYIQGDVLAFVRYVAESLHSLANAQNLMLRVESDQAKIIMDYDPERLLQIVHNLLSNAVKFTHSGGKVVLRANQEGSWLHLFVTDTGAGIPPDELPHLFERFFQAKNQEYAKAGGAGIGLSLVRELVKAMGGEITVESTVGKGSVFLVKLPVTNNAVFEVKEIETEKQPALARTLVQSDPNDDSGKPTILLIEDNPDVVEYLSACLKDVYNLDFAYNGQAGIEKALETVPDFIVSDVMMPFKDGFEVVEALKNDEHTSHIPIVLLTAKADVQSRLAGLRKGADAYLSKPFNQEELLVIIENLLETRRRLQAKYQQQLFIPVLPVAPDTATAIEDAFLQKVHAIIDAHYSNEDFGLPHLCQKIGMSRSQLFRKMKALTDIAPSDLIRTHRLNKAKALLETGEVNVSEAAWQTGFKDPSYFSKLYQEEFGIAPSATPTPKE